MRGLLVAKGPLREPRGDRDREARLRRGVGVGMGDGGAPRRAPLDSCLRRNDACGRPPSSALRTGPSRASGQALTGSGRTDLGGAPLVGIGVGMGDGDAPRRAPLDSCLRWNDACGRPPSSDLRTGFDRLRANGRGKRACGGEWGCDGGWRRPAPRPSGYRLSPVRRWGWGGWRVLLVSGGGPALAGRAIRESPLRRGVGVGSAKGVGDGGAPPMPLWIPAFAGMTQRGG